MKWRSSSLAAVAALVVAAPPMKHPIRIANRHRRGDGDWEHVAMCGRLPFGKSFLLVLR
jgi:hypothetical protein